MSTLIIVEHDNQVIEPSTRQVLNAALQLGENVVLLVVGHHCAAVATEAATLEGVQAVWHVDNACYEHQLAENISQLVAAIASPFTHILSASSTYGKNVLPRIAASLDTAQVSDVVRIVDKNTFEHPIYAGNAIETVRVLDDKKILSIRTTAFDAVTSRQPACSIEHMDKVFTHQNTTFIDHQLSESV